MELKKAINIINNFRTWYMGGDISNDVLQEIYKAIDTVLEELNNRIPIKKIKKVLEELDERVIYPDKCNYYARLTVSEVLFLKHFIENEILNKE